MNDTPSATDRGRTYLWCDRCRRSFRHDDAPDERCPVCGRDVRPIGKFAAIVRGLVANELAASPIETKHRQLVRMIWTRNGMGEEYFRVIAPDLSYNRFEARVTDLLCRGAEEGWVRFVFPAAPTSDETAYRVEFTDEERFLQELERLFPSTITTETSPA